MRFVGIILEIFFVISCSPAIRDKGVYKAEVDFIQAAADEQVERGIALIGESCECEDVYGVREFVTTACQELAETVLVVQSRMPYHTAFMLYLGGISEDRPPDSPPDVPETGTLCPAPGTTPKNVGLELDAGVGDASI